MGWKANCILLSERGDAVFAKFPPHQPARARELLPKLGFENRTFKENSDFAENVYLPDGSVAIGAYDSGLVLCGMKIDYPEKKSTLQLVQTLSQIYPSATILEIGLHSVVNFFHYKLWREGKVVRHYSGDADAGVTADQGELLPVEEPHFRNSELRGGKRIFFTERDGQRDEYDASAYGESLVFDVAGMLLGESLDSYEGEKLKLELFSGFDLSIPGVWGKFLMIWKKKSPGA